MVLQSLFLAGWKLVLLNPIAPKMAKTRWSFGHSECNRVKVKDMLPGEATLSFSYLPSLSKGSPLKKKSSSSKSRYHFGRAMQYREATVSQKLFPFVTVKEKHGDVLFTLNLYFIVHLSK